VDWKNLYARQLSIMLAMNQDLKARIYGLLEPEDGESKYFFYIIMGLILLNVAAVILETVDLFRLRYLLSSFRSIFLRHL